MNSLSTRITTSSLLLILFLAQAFGQTDTRLLAVVAKLDSIDRQFWIEDSEQVSGHPTSYYFLKEDAIIQKAELQKSVLEELSNIPDTELDPQDRISKAILELKTKNQISEVQYKRYLIPFNSEGGFFNAPVYFISTLPFESVADFEAYLNWVPSFADYIEYNIELLKKGTKDDIMAPKVIVSNVLNLLKPWMTDKVEEHPFYDPLTQMPESISITESERIKNQARSLMEKEIIPAYKQLQEYLEKDYLRKAPTAVGVSNSNNGKAFYEDRILHFTTLSMTPDSVYKIGLTEVSRIRSSMEQIIESLQFDGSFQDFIGFLRTDPQFYPNTPQELLNQAAWLSKKAEAQLPRMFSNLYELPFTVAPVPDHIAPNYTGGRYVPGSRERNRAGTYWVNTYNLPSRPFYTLPSLTLHEAVPGHHLQITLASELIGLPDFRTSYYISAFGEGWGLYAEYLGEEMGMYETPYELFGRYTYEMWRACRLVVDVGMHDKGWTREEAVKFMADNTALSLHEVNTEIDRYIGWPGQAVSYKIGELTIKRLRADCERALGDDFDIQEFHHVILKNGSIPLSVMEDQVKQYLRSKESK